MPVTTAFCNSFKQELLAMSPHTPTDTYRIVLIRAGHTGTYGANTTNVGTPGTGSPSSSNLGTDAVPISGDYNNVNGMPLAGFTVSLDGSTAILTFTDPVAWANATISADGAIIYNATRTNRACAVYAFAGAPITSTNGNFDVNLPAVTASTGLIRIA
jgi:hypothetical protein